MNKKAKLNMVSFKNEDDEILNEIKEETAKNEERQEIEINEEGFKKFNGLTFIPKKKERLIIERFHDDIREGHPGISRTMEKIQRNLYFPGMYRKVKKYITECDSCKRNKNDYIIANQKGN